MLEAGAMPGRAPHNVTQNFQYNPALYVSNRDVRNVVGYIVGTYTFTLWSPTAR
jgi:hypothetical protein